MSEDHCLGEVSIFTIFTELNNLTLTFPMRLAIEDATSIDADEMMLVVKNMEPSFPSGNSNLRLKKYVIQDSDAKPEAKASRPSRMNKLITINARFLSTDEKKDSLRGSWSSGLSSIKGRSLPKYLAGHEMHCPSSSAHPKSPRHSD